MISTRIGLTALLAGVLAGFPVAHAQQENEEDGAVRETRETGVFRGALHSVWAKLRALSPRPNAEAAGRGRMVVTAGIRGSESTESTLKPYWKDDRSRDEAFVEQVETLNAATSLVDDGRLTEAVKALNGFIETYPDSDLLPNALFARGLTQSVNGDPDGGIETLRDFVKNYPNHPLKSDAELVIAEVTRTGG